MKLRLLSTLLLASSLSACSLMPSWLGESENTPLPGKRETVLSTRGGLVADPSLGSSVVSLATPVANSEWRNPGQWQNQHLRLSDLNRQSTYDVGSAPQDGFLITSQPVIAHGMLFTLDGKGIVSARDLANPQRMVWQKRAPTGETRGEFLDINTGKTSKDFLGGNLTAAGDTIFIATAEGLLLAANARTGEQLWQRSLQVPVRSSPVADNGTLFVITVDNQLLALDGANGKTRWTHSGLKENLTLQGSPAPAIAKTQGGGILLAPYSSGELIALDLATGKPRWGDLLSGDGSKGSSFYQIRDIDGTPAVDRGIVFAGSNQNTVAAFKLDTGERLWERNISTLQSPWVSGDHVFVLSTNDELVALNRMDGRIRWVAQMQGYENEEDKKDRIVWSGPVVAGNQLWLVGSHGKLIAVNPVDGSIARKISVPEHIYLPPVIANQTLYLLSNDAELAVLQ